ncbi:MAG: TonB-dependent receptor [Caulobacteraceae bacterium]|nr:TonB-dependent receptor [Caulobacteraceae bacterium]
MKVTVKVGAVRGGLKRVFLLQASALAACAAWAPAALAEAPAASGAAPTVAEVIVTAQKRSERLQDVPISITALTQDSLQKQGLKAMGDYLLAQPSVVIEDRGPARNQVVIRGVATTSEFENPTVAFYFGEAPVNNGLGFGAYGFPDLKTFDVGRVEILRGPQGTLYGAGSMGGAVKIVPNEPRFGVYGADLEASVSNTAHGGTGYDVAGAVNLPLGDDFAARLVGYRYQDAGYIRNDYAGSPDPSKPVAALGGLSWTDVGVSSFGVPARHQANANQTDTDGGRAYLAFKPNDRFKVTLGALYQKSIGDGLPENLPSQGYYEQSRMIAERLDDTFSLFTAVASYDFGPASLTSATSYMTRTQGQDRDVSTFFLDSPLSLHDQNENKTFVQEIRLASEGATRLNWLAGAFYEHETATATQNLKWNGTSQSLTEFTTLLTALGSLPGPASAGDTLFRRDDHDKADQVAGFGQVTYEFLPHFSATAGVRVAHYQTNTNALSDGLFNGGLTSYAISDSETVTTPKFELDYKPDSDLMYYASASKGFRLGAPNQTVPSTCGADLASLGLSSVPSAVKSDSLWSYEVGAKQRLAQGRVTLNGALYYIDWSNIQTSFLLPTCGFSFSANAGNAKSQGVELSLTWRVTSDLTADMSASYTDARLTQDSPRDSGVGGKSGDRLPGIPQWTVQGALQYDFNLAGHDGFARTDARYVSGYLNRFPGASGGAQAAGDYAVVDLRVGLNLTSQIRAEAFANNLFDAHQLILVDTELSDGREVIGRPRTVGLSLHYDY